jgi:hypothetical protein
MATTGPAVKTECDRWSASMETAVREKSVPRRRLSLSKRMKPATPALEGKASTADHYLGSPLVCRSGLSGNTTMSRTNTEEVVL